VVERRSLMAEKESKFQANLIKELKAKYPECVVMKNDATYIQGIPDLLILYNDKWAALECKKSKTAHKQPNQEYYVDKMNSMSFAKFINPENKEDILDELSQTFES
jgi:hypothetical protein